MADNEDREEITSRGNEWEVVSLTASTYAAAPGPKQNDDEKDTAVGENESETSHAMVMSGHFIFPPRQREEEGGISNTKEEENWNFKGLAESDDFSGIQFFDEKDSDVDSDISHFPKNSDEDKYDGSDLPCKAWWKRQASSLYAHAKEANTFWSIFVAAAVMGLGA
ncbi:unnamed protein product [Ilex paraguariensis]|uniref:Uncharacterized protein n=1 Tax=Ilex paraguariensis TaxID=185542 RepID=A0ABC8RLA1_9AQUA